MSTQRRSPNRRAFLHRPPPPSVLIATGARAPNRAGPIVRSRSSCLIRPAAPTDVLARIHGRAAEGHFRAVLRGREPPRRRRQYRHRARSPASAPDGYTIGAATIGHFAINQFLYSKMPYDPERDMIPASLTWELPNVFVVASDYVPAKTMAEFLAWAKQKGKISFGSPGVGTSPHLSGVLFAQRTGLDAVHVPFRGAAQTIPAMLSGDVNFALDNLASYVSLIQSGKMRALAVTSAQRWPTLPDVPTMAEAGLKDFVVTSWARLRTAGGHAAPDRRQAVRRHEADRGRPGHPEALSGGRRALDLQHAGRGASPSPPRSGRCGKTWSRCRALKPAVAGSRCVRAAQLC